MSEVFDMSKAFDIVLGIERIKYEESFFSIEKMDIGWKRVYEIFADGKIKYAFYEGRNRKATQRMMAIIEQDRIISLYSDVINCLKTATCVTDLVDDCGATITINYWAGEINLPRGLGNQSNLVSSIISEFLDKVVFK